MPDAFTIRIFMPDGDPDGVRIVDRMNWTGKAIVFPRSGWEQVKQRDEFSNAGVYILIGYEDDELPTIYIGQGEQMRIRIDSHDREKEFWDKGIVFVSQNHGLNRAHITWLEYALVRDAVNAERCKLENSTTPTEPSMSEAEKADTESFLMEVLQILPLVDLRVFEPPTPVATPSATVMPSSEDPSELSADGEDMVVVVPARISDADYKAMFESVFFGDDEKDPSWYAIRIAGKRLSQIKYLAIYQGAPISEITHYAPVDRIEPYGNDGKYRLVFSEPPREIRPVEFGNAPQGTMQSPRYTTLDKLLNANKLTDLWP